MKPSSPAPQREITLRVILVSFFLTLLLAASNCFLALKIGYLTSASIPAAILSMGILRLFKNSSMLENNLIQTSASAGEAIAGGIAYTAPALILIHYWFGFDYFKTFLLALTSGVLGVLFSTPLRHFLVTDKRLTFPEGRAIAEILKAGAKKTIGLKEILWGGATGALLELAQSGFQVISNSLQYWRWVGSSLFGFGLGFSATMVGAGYLMGFQIALSLLVGAIIGFGIGIPLLTHLHPITHITTDATTIATQLWQEHIRYVGIGAMLFAGLWTVTGLFRPLLNSLKIVVKRFFQPHPMQEKQLISATEKDLPAQYLLVGIFIMSILLFFVFQNTLNLSALDISSFWQTPFLLSALIYMLIIGFIFSAICGYFSGLVGVSATPGSAIVIAGLLLTAVILKTTHTLYWGISTHYIQEAVAMTILIGCVITGIAAISNDNIQDLKTGYILGATPWKQQVMLLFGAVISAAIIPLLMQLLFSVYGMGNVLPHAGMNPMHTLSVPPAMMMATLSQSVFQHDLPWELMLTGALIVAFFIAINRYLIPEKQVLSPLGIAIGIYLPITTTTPLFIGGLFSLFARGSLTPQRPILLACGLVSGAALMDVILAIPFAITQNTDVLRLLPKNFPLFIPNMLGLVTLVGLGMWFWRMTNKKV